MKREMNSGASGGKRWTASAVGGLILVGALMSGGQAWSSGAGLSDEVVADGGHLLGAAGTDAGYVAEFDATPHLHAYAKLVHAAYVASATSAATLQDAISVFLKDPTQSNLIGARRAWKNARVAYLQTEVFRFYDGPIDGIDPVTGKEGPEGRINAWPMNEAHIDYVAGAPDSGLINDLSVPITRDEVLSRDQTDDEANVTTGWHAIEFMLWGQDLNAYGAGERPASDFATGDDVRERRRAYLQMVTDMLVEDLQAMVAAWAPGDPKNYAATFVAMEQREALSRVLTGMAMLSAFELGSERLSVALDSGDQEDEHSCFSDNTNADFIYDARGIRNVYFGDYGTQAGVGLDELVGSLSPSLNREMIARLNQTDAAVAEVDAPFDRVLAASPDSLPRQEAELLVASLNAQAETLVKIGKLLGVRVITSE